MNMLHIYFEENGKVFLIRSKNDAGPWRWCGNVVSANVHETVTFAELMSKCIDYQISDNDKFISTVDVLKIAKEKSWRSFFKKYNLLVLQWNGKSKYVVQLWERINNDAYQPSSPERLFRKKEELICSILETITHHQDG